RSDSLELKREGTRGSSHAPDLPTATSSWLRNSARKGVAVAGEQIREYGQDRVGFNGFDTAENYFHFSVWLAWAGPNDRLPPLLFLPFSFVAPMTAYDDLMPDSSGSADVMYNILGCRHSHLCNTLQQALEHIDDYDAEVGGQSENEHFLVAARRNFFLQDYRTPASAIFTRLFSFYTLYCKRPGYAFLFDLSTLCTFLFTSFQFRKALALL
ncbi:hypothetical protein IFM61606_04747, partial [Aspergillus udagawae]